MSDLTRSLRLPPPAGHPDSAQAMMRDVLVALTPALAMAVFSLRSPGLAPHRRVGGQLRAV